MYCRNLVIKRTGTEKREAKPQREETDQLLTVDSAALEALARRLEKPGAEER
jgi:NADPH-dependent ferric siderophore reductase